MKNNKISFADWMKKVDEILMTALYLDSRDLPDCCYRDWHESGMSPADAARQAIRDAQN